MRMCRFDRADAMRWVEAEPAKIGDKSLCPGMTCILRGEVLAAVVAADVARGDADAARGGNKDVGKILTDAALEAIGFGGRRAGIGWARIESQFTVEAGEQRVQKCEIVGAAGTAQLGCETADCGVVLRESRFAQKQARGKPLGGVTHQPLRVLGIDRAFDADGDAVERSVCRECMRCSPPPPR